MNMSLSRPESCIDGLNDKQQEAVLHQNGPLLVLAGAGSGKTRVITHRIAHLIALGTAPKDILAVTFTNKAAREMRERLRHMIGDKAKKVTLSTFHAFGLKFLKTERRRKDRHGNTSQSATFAIFDTGDQLACLKEIAKTISFGKPLKMPAILARISDFKNHFLMPDDIESTGDPYHDAALVFYEKYIEQLQAYNAYDFDDLVCAPVHMMRADPEVKQRWQKKYEYIMVDEYQDTNTAQMELLKLLSDNPARPKQNIVVVGDDDQSIYSWRGAEVKHILRFPQSFANAQTIALVKNYRSMGRILAAANAVIKKNKTRHGKSLEASRGDGPAIKVVKAPDHEAEVTWTVNHIRSFLDRGKMAGDIAVLYRSNRLARDLENELRASGIEYNLIGGTAFFERKEVKDVLAYLKLIVNPKDDLSLRRIINVPSRQIGATRIQKLAKLASDWRISMFASLGRLDEDNCEDSALLASGVAFHDLISDLQDQLDNLPADANPAHFAKTVVEASGLLDNISGRAETLKEAEFRKMNIEAFLRGMERYCEKATDLGLTGYLERMALDTRADETDVNAMRKITLSTLHGAKGLEFPIVVMIGMEEGILPHDRSLMPHQDDLPANEDGGIDEERRLCYVGITRAKDELALTYALTRPIRGRLQPRTISRFLQDIPAEITEKIDLSDEPDIEDVATMLASLKLSLAD